MIEIPAAFVQGTVEREGERGAAWLAQLPQVVDEMLCAGRAHRTGRFCTGASGSSFRYGWEQVG